MQAISSYEVVGDKLLVKTPFCEAVVDQCRAWAGKFDKEVGAWVLPVVRLAEVQKRLGSGFDDLVQVEVGSGDWQGYQQIHVGWHVLAGRRGRDYGADVYADLVAGSIPSRGGSVKNPAVNESSDARFRLWVPRDFAFSRELSIVDDPREGSPVEVSVEAELLEFVQKLRDLASRGDHLHDGEVLAEVRGDYCGELLARATGK